MLEVVRPRHAIEGDEGRLQADLTHLSGAGERGRVRIGSLFLLLLLAAMILIGIQMVSAYGDYFALREIVRLTVSEVVMAPHRAEEGHARILANARELGLPLAEEQVALRVEGGKVLARVRWQQPIGLWQYTIPVTFEIEESKSLR